jgi:uncharacterized protein YbcI
VSLDTPTHVGGTDGSRPLEDLSRAIVRLYKEHFGRGPTRSRSAWVGEDAVICVLEDTLTAAERTLQQLDEHPRLRELRMVFQYALEDQFKAIAEQIFGRKVRAFISGLDPSSGVATETFLFEPGSLPT